MKFFAVSAFFASASALRRGDAYPATILPGSEPIMPIPSEPILLQQSMESS